jgi:hypothetical protein
MFDFPTIAACFALLLLLGGIISSAKLLHGPAAQRLDWRVVSNPAAERSSMLLLGSLVLSLIAAGSAVIWHFVP